MAEATPRTCQQGVIGTMGSEKDYERGVELLIASKMSPSQVSKTPLQ